MLSKTKKAIILAGMLVLLVVTGYLNIVLNSVAEEPINNDDQSNMSFFDGHRLDRQTSREQTLLILEGIITSAESSEADISAANAEKVAISQLIQLELTLESLIKAKGFDDCVVTATTENINVIVSAEDNLTKAQAAQILDIVVRETGRSPVNIRIIPV